MDSKVLEAVMEYLEAAMYRMDSSNALTRIMELCETDGLCTVDVIAVEKSILRHFVKLYDIDGWDAYCNFRAA